MLLLQISICLSQYPIGILLTTKAHDTIVLREKLPEKRRIRLVWEAWEKKHMSTTVRTPGDTQPCASGSDSSGRRHRDNTLHGSASIEGAAWMDHEVEGRRHRTWWLRERRTPW
jgi:hypothetical protein